MKELVEKISALYAEFEKDATAQADKGNKLQVREQERFHSLWRRNSKILDACHSRQQSNLNKILNYVWNEEWSNPLFVFLIFLNSELDC